MYENNIRSSRKRYSGVTMINLRKPIVRFEKDSLYRVTKEPDTYLKIENRVYYFYTRLNNYLNYNMHMRYLIVTKQGWYKVVNGEMFDIKRKQKSSHYLIMMMKLWQSNHYTQIYSTSSRHIIKFF